MTSDNLDTLALPPAYTLLDNLPLPLIIYRRDGLMVAMNRQAEQFWGLSREQVIGKFNILADPQSVEHGSRDMFAQVLSGHTVESGPNLYDTSRAPQAQEITNPPDRRIWIQPLFFPLCDAAGTISHVAGLYRDVTAQVEQLRTIQQAQEQIEAQRTVIHELSSPVVQVWEGILAMPLVGMIDARRAQTITENLLAAVARSSAAIVILDITGVPVVDTAIADYLLKAAQTVRLIGSEVAIVGIRSEIAQTLVHLGVDLSGLVTHADLRAGIAWAFQRQGLQVTRRTPVSRP